MQLTLHLSTGLPSEEVFVKTQLTAADLTMPFTDFLARLGEPALKALWQQAKRKKAE